MVDFEQKGDVLRLSYVDENGQIRISQNDIPKSEQFIWVYCDDNDPQRSKDFLSFDGKAIKKKHRLYLNNFRVYEVLGKISESAKKKLYSYHQPKKFFMDIEVAVGDDFPHANEAEMPVLTYALVDEKNTVYVFGIKEKLGKERLQLLQDRINDYFSVLNEKFVVKYKFYETEALMLMDFFYKLAPKMPFISGWNFVKFDWQYLTVRAKKFNIKHEKCSPTETVSSVYIRDKFDQTKVDIVEVPNHKIIVDYLQVYEKWDTSVQIKESGQLDWVAEEILGVKKLHYDGTLMELYERDYDRYLWYNAVDTILVMLIDRKLQTFNTAIKLSNKGEVPLKDAFSPSIIIASLEGKEHYRRGRILIEDRERNKRNEEGGSYTGGYVKEPEVGSHEGVAGWDFRSMFPSIILQYNTGSDSLIGIMNEGTRTFTNFQGEIIEINPKEHIFMASGAVYTKKFSSVMRTVVKELFDDRISVNTMANEIDIEISRLKNLLKPA